MTHVNSTELALNMRMGSEAKASPSRRHLNLLEHLAKTTTGGAET
jgi:hypothetical protein